eukprot:10546589-Lingulodinium_polyedra.AAC.1
MAACARCPCARATCPAKESCAETTRSSQDCCCSSPLMSARTRRLCLINISPRVAVPLRWHASMEHQNVRHMERTFCNMRWLQKNVDVRCSKLARTV